VDARQQQLRDLAATQS